MASRPGIPEGLEQAHTIGIVAVQHAHMVKTLFAGHPCQHRPLRAVRQGRAEKEVAVVRQRQRGRRRRGADRGYARRTRDPFHDGKRVAAGGGPDYRVDALLLHQPTGLCHGLLGVPRGVAHHELDGLAEDPSRDVDVLHGQLEGPLAFNGPRRRPLAQVNHQPQPQRTGLIGRSIAAATSHPMARLAANASRTNLVHVLGGRGLSLSLAIAASLLSV